MNNSHFLEATGMFRFPLIIVLLSIYIGQRWGLYVRKISEDTKLQGK